MFRKELENDSKWVGKRFETSRRRNRKRFGNNLKRVRRQSQENSKRTHGELEELDGELERDSRANSEAILWEVERDSREIRRRRLPKLSSHPSKLVTSALRLDRAFREPRSPVQRPSSRPLNPMNNDTKIPHRVRVSRSRFDHNISITVTHFRHNNGGNPVTFRPIAKRHERRQSPRGDVSSPRSWNVPLESGATRPPRALSLRTSRWRRATVHFPRRFSLHFPQRGEIARSAGSLPRTT